MSVNWSKGKPEVTTSGGGTTSVSVVTPASGRIAMHVTAKEGPYPPQADQEAEAS